MKLIASQTPQRFVRAFKCKTLIALQVATGGSVFFSRTQGDAAGAANGVGMELTNANTNGGQPPWTNFWQGELWYSTTTPSPGVAFNIEVLTEDIAV